MTPQAKRKLGGRVNREQKQIRAIKKKINRQTKKPSRRLNRNRRTRMSNGFSGGAQMSLSQAPVATSTRVKMSRKRQGSTSIFEVEYIIPVMGSTTAYSATVFPINPGLSGTFPWLSQIANRFEMYSFRRLDFKYVTSTSTATTGNVMMAFDPDVLDAAPTSKQQQMAYPGAISDVAWKDIVCVIPPKSRFAKELFIRNAAVDGSDQKTYDLGSFILGVQGNGTTNQIGDLYVSYDVVLNFPDLTTATGFSGSAFSLFKTTPTTTSPFGGGVITGNTGMVSSVTAQTITFNGLFHYVFSGWVEATDVSTGDADFTAVGGSFTTGPEVVVNSADTVAAFYMIGTGTGITYVPNSGYTGGSLLQCTLAIIPSSITLPLVSSLEKTFENSGIDLKLLKRLSESYRRIKSKEVDSSSDEEEKKPYERSKVDGSGAPVCLDKDSGCRICNPSGAIKVTIPKEECVDNFQYKEIKTTPIRLVVCPDSRDESLPLLKDLMKDTNYTAGSCTQHK